ncbi:MAG: hypothetical protein EAZ97_12970 [Bacteroidetes bacterium]|nr:MAG: hypothetical protein EAZ97_12970 [Bacteroidota bacterium]
MEIILDKKDNVTASIQIKMSEVDYQPSVDKKLKEYAKKVNIKGFRPGKVPMEVVRKMYGKGVLAEEINQIAADHLNNYVKEQNIQLLIPPMFDEVATPALNLDSKNGFEFIYELGFRPDFDESLLKNVHLTKTQMEITEQEYTEYLKVLRNYHGEHINPEVSELSDMLTGQMMAVEGDYKKHIMFFPKDLAESEQAKFVGIGAGAEITFDIKTVFNNEDVFEKVFKPKDDEEKAKLLGEFKFVVGRIHRSIEAEMNGTFFGKVLGNGSEEIISEEQFHEKVKFHIARKYQFDSENALLEEFYSAVVDKFDPILPDGLLKKWLKLNYKITEEDQLDATLDDYKKSLRWEIIRESIAQKHEIKTEAAEVIAFVKEANFSQYFMMNLFLNDQMLDYVADMFFKEKQNQPQIMSYQNMLIGKKILDKLNGELNITTVISNKTDFDTNILKVGQ